MSIGVGILKQYYIFTCIVRMIFTVYTLSYDYYFLTDSPDFHRTTPNLRKFTRVTKTLSFVVRLATL